MLAVSLLNQNCFKNLVCKDLFIFVWTIPYLSPVWRIMTWQRLEEECNVILSDVSSIFLNNVFRNYSGDSPREGGVHLLVVRHRPAPAQQFHPQLEVLSRSTQSPAWWPSQCKRAFSYSKDSVFHQTFTFDILFSFP